MEDPVPPRVREYAEQAVTYVRNALGVTLEYDSNTLPLLGTSNPANKPSKVDLPLPDAPSNTTNSPG